MGIDFALFKKTCENATTVPLAHLLMCTLLFIFSEDLPRDLHWQQRPTLPHAESDWISFGAVGDNDYFGFMAACDGHLQILQWWQVSCNLYACGIEIQFAFIVACVLGKMQLSFFYCLLGLNPAKVPSKCNGERQNAIMTSRPLEGNWLRFASRRFWAHGPRIHHFPLHHWHYHPPQFFSDLDCGQFDHWFSVEYGGNGANLLHWVFHSQFGLVLLWVPLGEEEYAAGHYGFAVLPDRYVLLHDVASKTTIQYVHAMSPCRKWL